VHQTRKQIGTKVCLSLQCIAFYAGNNSAKNNLTKATGTHLNEARQYYRGE
jgi:hypothetical protein